MDRKLNAKGMGKMMRYTWLILISIGVILPMGALAQDTDDILTMKRHQMEGMERMAPLGQTLQQLEEVYNVNIFYQSREVEDKFARSIAERCTEIEVHLSLLPTPLGLTYRKLTEKSFGVYQKAQPEGQRTTLQETVSGQVRDAESAETLPGVNVMVKGT